jgi:muramoyltetrapeptide carboxypeptidase
MELCQLPPSLNPGDRLWVITPSGTLREPEALHQGVEIWRQRGYQVELSAGVSDRWGYLAGTDSDRRQELLAGLKTLEIKGILCGRGGYGGARLLEDWHWPAVPPKWLIGFSDITALLWSYTRQGVAGIHGPVLTTLAAEPDWSVQRLFDAVEGRPLAPLTGIGWGGGEVKGILLPANLTVATHLLGTEAQPDLTGVILALEDVGEAPYRIDRMLTQWRSSQALRAVKGIALGRFSQCDAPENIPSFTVEQVLRERLQDLGIPIVSELPFGHQGANAALPVGVNVNLDGDRGILSFPEFGIS